MPIFIDRHDMRDMTAESDRRRASQGSRNPGQVRGQVHDLLVRSHRGTGFCLVDAPDAATAERFTAKAMARSRPISSRSILTAVEAFLGRIGDPKTDPRTAAPVMDAGLRAVMFTDIVGSTEMTSRLGDAAALRLVRVHDTLVRRGLTAYRGRAVKHTGDGIMAAFDDVANAVKAAAEIQRQFSAYNSTLPKVSTCGSASTPASRWPIMTICSARQCSSLPDCAARPRRMELSSPRSSASCAAWTPGALSRWVSGG